MAEEKKKQIQSDQEQPHLEIDGVKHYVSEMNEQQIGIYNHLQDLEKKIGNLRFNLVQLQVGQQAFFDVYRASLKDKEAKVEQE
jgi:hypothetical protein